MSRPIFAVPIEIEFEPTICTWRAGETGQLSWEPPSNSEEIPVAQHLDAWEVRGEFMAVRTDEALLAFLEHTGAFSVRTGQSVWSVDKMMRWQPVFASLLATNPLKWPELDLEPLYARMIASHRVFKVDFHWRNTKHRPYGEYGKISSHSQHSARIRCTDTLSALLASIYVDHLRGAQFRFCKLDTCRKPFELDSAHERLFCRNECAHTSAMRDYRARQRNRKRTTR